LWFWRLGLWPKPPNPNPQSPIPNPQEKYNISEYKIKVKRIHKLLNIKNILYKK